VFIYSVLYCTFRVDQSGGCSPETDVCKECKMSRNAPISCYIISYSKDTHWG